MKVKWDRTIPKEEGFYWVKFYNGRWHVEPGELHRFDKGKTVIVQCRHGTFVAGPHHGGPQLSLGGKHKRVWFSKIMEMPDEVTGYYEEFNARQAAS